MTVAGSIESISSLAVLFTGCARTVAATSTVRGTRHDLGPPQARAQDHPGLHPASAGRRHARAPRTRMADDRAGSCDSGRRVRLGAKAVGPVEAGRREARPEAAEAAGR